VTHLVILLHRSHGLAISNLPLIDVAQFAGEVLLMNLVDGVKTTESVTKQEQKFVRHDEWNINSCFSVIAFKVTTLFLSILKICLDMLVPHLADIV